jgi:hypothetical protein
MYASTRASETMQAGPVTAVLLNQERGLKALNVSRLSA